jgi:putative acetyltransferase
MSDDSVEKVTIVQAETDETIAVAKELFLEYAASLGFDLCFQNFDRELAGLPGDYAPPSGRLLVAFEKGNAVGCVALRRLEAGVCEMKRLYVRPAHRGRELGRTLAERITEEARKIGYEKIRLDAIRTMEPAVSLYRTMGFEEIAPYRANPIEGAVYMELWLFRGP